MRENSWGYMNSLSKRTLSEIASRPLSLRDEVDRRAQKEVDERNYSTKELSWLLLINSRSFSMVIITPRVG